MSAAAGVVRAGVPWADVQRACPLLDVRSASRAGYNASGRALMGGATFLLLCGNANPADLWGRRSTGTGWDHPALTELFAADDLPVPHLDRNISDGFVVLAQDGLPVLTLDVGG